MFYDFLCIIFWCVNFVSVKSIPNIPGCPTHGGQLGVSWTNVANPLSNQIKYSSSFSSNATLLLVKSSVNISIFNLGRHCMFAIVPGCWLLSLVFERTECVSVLNSIWIFLLIGILQFLQNKYSKFAYWTLEGVRASFFWRSSTVY